MSDPVIIIQLGPRTDKEQMKTEKTSTGRKDVWDFGGIRTTLWGAGGSKDPIGVRGFRQTLWGV